MRVYFHGNCQASCLAKTMMIYRPSWNISFYEVHEEKIKEEFENYKELVCNSDVIVSQPISTWYKGGEHFSLDWIFTNKRQDAKLLTFPSLYFRGQHPSTYYLNDCGRIDSYGMPYHDIAFLYLMSKDFNQSQAVNAICRDDFYDSSFIESEYMRAVLELDRREKELNITIPVSQWLNLNGREKQLFHVLNHPEVPVFQYVAERILDALGESLEVETECQDFNPFPHIPMPSSLARYFNINPEGNNYKLWGYRRDIIRQDYYRTVFELMINRGVDRLRTLILSQGEQSEFISRFEKCDSYSEVMKK